MQSIKMLVNFLSPEENKKENLEEYIEEICEKISKIYDIKSDFFVFRKRNFHKDVFITFKALVEADQVELENTKFINWKPETNTFFSINALNFLIMGEIGTLDKNHNINWSNHRNRIITVRNHFNEDNSVTKTISENTIERIMRLTKVDNKFDILHYTKGE